MYSTSEAYKEAVNNNVIKSMVSGTITLENGAVLNVSDKEIVPGSLSFNNRCINGSSFGFGAVYVGELNITLLKSIDRYSLYNAKVEISYYITLSDGTEEAVPLGVYYVYEPKRTRRMISLKCYDCMTDFDVNVEDDTNGTPYELLNYICGICGVEMEQTEEEISALCNGMKNFYIMSENVGTYRDAISYIASMLACFATINRNGKLQLCTFSTESCTSINANRRTTSTIADYETYYCGIKARFLANQNFYPYKQVDETITDGLILDMGDIPIVSGDDDTKNEVLANVLSVLKFIRYVPTDFSFVGDPSIELGDMITLNSVNATSDSVNTIVTSFTWTYHSAQKIASSGDNTKLQGVKSNEEKRFSQIEQTVSSKDIIVHSFTNSKEITISSKEVTVILFNFATIENCKPVFIATIPIAMDIDGNVVVKYYIDGVLIDSDTLTKYLERGTHFITISNNFEMNKNSRATLLVKLCTEAFESDTRQQAAKILSFEDYINTGTYTEHEVDATVPKVTIAKSSIRAVLYAQGLAGTMVWDGTINVAEEIPAEVTVKDATSVAHSVIGLAETILTNLNNNAVSDVINVISVEVENIEIVGASDEIVVEWDAE